jgi:two-component system, sensor histidine kinase and response regulator
VLLTSVGEGGNPTVFAAVPTKPARQLLLLTTLARVLGHKTPSEVAPARPSTSMGDVAPSELKGPLVLVAEDTRVNQLVARRMLARLGCRVDVVGNGREAVAALELIPYGVIMMDVQMPEMNGFEATTEIRRREGLGQRRTPMIAMTANALQGRPGARPGRRNGRLCEQASSPQGLEAVVGRWVTLLQH